MSRYLITHSLLSSWLHGIKDNPFEDATTEKDAYAEFLDYLNRIPSEPTEAMQDGIEFENLVTSIANGTYKPTEKFVLDKNGDPTINPNSGDPFVTYEYHKWYDAAKKAAMIVKGGQFQYKAQKTITVDGISFLLFGKLDVLKAGDIIDTKFSKSYDRGKYFSSTQHPMYLELIPEARRFQYLISNGVDVWTETYVREDTPSIIPIIADFSEWLSAHGLFNTYAEKWEAK